MRSDYRLYRVTREFGFNVKRVLYSAANLALVLVGKSVEFRRGTATTAVKINVLLIKERQYHIFEVK